MNKIIRDVIQYVRHDWHSNRVRFCAEVFAWACSVVSAVIFAATVPHIPVVPLYFAAPRPVVRRSGVLIVRDDERLPLEPGEVPEMKLVRFRSLGCYPLSAAVESTAATLDDIIDEMRTSRESERAGRLIDTDEAASMEKKKREGYF